MTLELGPRKLGPVQGKREVTGPEIELFYNFKFFKNFRKPHFNLSKIISAYQSLIVILI